MKKIIIILLIFGPFFYANHKKPPMINHQQAIFQSAAGSNAAVDEEVYKMPQWDGLEYVDWKFVTATRDKSKQSLVSFGIVNYINVVDKDWGSKTLGIKPSETEGASK